MTVRHAVLETRAGKGYSTLRGLDEDTVGFIQATELWNQHRLSEFLKRNPGNTVALNLLAESRAGRLRSFASFLRNDRLFLIPQSKSPVSGIRL